MLALLLAAGTIALSLMSVHAEPVLVSQPKEAVERADAFLEAVCRGDYAAAGDMMQGQPDLGADRDPAEEAGKLLWDAMVESFSYTHQGPCYATDTGVAMDLNFTRLDLSSVTDSLGDRSQKLLEMRVEQAENVDEIYDENNEYREDAVMEVLLEATEDALREDAENTTQELTIHMVYEAHRWWVVPTEQLLNAISGGVMD